jgi:hypothetical protein
MDYIPPADEIAERREWFTTELDALLADPPRRTADQVIQHWLPLVRDAYARWVITSAADFAADRALREMVSYVELRPWEEVPEADQLAVQELAALAQARRDEEQETNESYMVLRNRFSWELAYSIHHKEMLDEMAANLARQAAPALAALPASVGWRQRLRVAAALGRKVSAILDQQKPASPRRLLRGLPLVVVGV